MSHTKRTLFLIILLIMLSSLAWGCTPAAPQIAVSRVQDELRQVALLTPDEVVNVIVQKAGEGTAASERAVALGAVITKDLSMIHAFGAKMTARAAHDLADDPSVRWVSLDAQMKNSDDDEVVYTTWASLASIQNASVVTNLSDAVDSAQGPNGEFTSSTNGVISFTGFTPEVTPGYAIAKVEMLVSAYVPTPLRSYESLKIDVLFNGVKSTTWNVPGTYVNYYFGRNNGQVTAIDVTRMRKWIWSDLFSKMEFVVDQSKLVAPSRFSIDAVGMRITSRPGSDPSAAPMPAPEAKQVVKTDKLSSAFLYAVNAPKVWNEAPRYLQGQGVTVAVLDSGMIKGLEIGGRLISNINFNKGKHDSTDEYGHGTFVGSIIASNGKTTGGTYMGTAPKVNIINMRVSDDEGLTDESDVIEALQWVYQNRTRYNIRVANLSLNASQPQSYHTSPLCAAVEILWMNGVTVVVSAGNNGTSDLYPPANDPFVISVGATNDQGTPDIADDTMAGFSAYGVTEAGTAKPEIVAPGVKLTAYLPGNIYTKMGKDHSNSIVDVDFFKMSGTSASAPVVSGAVALLAQAEPSLTPDQIKYRLMSTAVKDGWGYDPERSGAGLLDIYAALHTPTTESVNTGLEASQMLFTGENPVWNSVAWNSVAWNSVAWNSVAWNSVAWNSVAWNSVAWNSDYWDEE